MTNGHDFLQPMAVVVPESPTRYKTHPGLTKREYFAAMAMQGLLATKNYTGDFSDISDAVEFADALINALNKEAK